MSFRRSMRMVCMLAIAACSSPAAPLPGSTAQQLESPHSAESRVDHVRSENVRSENVRGERAQGDTAQAGRAPLETAREPLPDPIRIDVAHERAIDDAVRAAIGAGEMVGAVVLVGDASGVLFERAYGDLATEPAVEPMLTDTVFDLASVTKVFTTLAILRLVDAGRLRLETDVGDFFPSLTGRTVEDLLYHRGGIAAVDRLDDYETEREANITRIVAMEAARPGPFRYSDLGYVVLGEIVARVSETDLDAAMRTLVVAPLRLDVRFNPVGHIDASRIAPTEFAPRRGAEGEPPPMVRGVVHDPRAFRLGGVAGHAGLFGTARDVAAIARLLLGAETYRNFLSEGLRRRMVTPQRVGREHRALGLEVHEAGVAHRGFTGTYFHVEPGQDRFAVVMSNAVHPNGQGDANPLRANVRRILREIVKVPPPRPDLQLGIDVLRSQGYARLAGRRVALFTHDAAVARDGQTTRRLLERDPRVDLRVLFSPEHGLGGTEEGRIEDGEIDGARLYSLFGRHRDPPEESFQHFDVLVVDVQDVGVRFYTYLASMHRLLRAAAQHQTPVIILDRPNPLGGVRVAGPLVDEAHRTFINHHRLPIVHGLTAGEMARLIVAEDSLALDLDVVPLEGWGGEAWAETGLRWLAPSPNLRSLEALALYPGVALVEGTNVSVGRGTATPFQLVGAPWVDGEALARVVRAAGTEAVVTRFRPSARPHRGRWCQGVRLSAGGDPIALGLALLAALGSHAPFQGQRAAGLVADDRVLEAALRGEPGLGDSFRTALRAYDARRAPHLLYSREVSAPTR